MSMSQFEKIRVVLAEPNSKLRADLKDSLHGFGFKNVNDTGNMSQVVNAVDRGDVDILIADTSLPEGDFNVYVNELRHGHQGENPFLVVITLVNEPSAAAVHEAINSGTDHVLAKPFTVEALIEKVADLTHARKRFVVTANYIGPDRRSAHRADATQTGALQIPLIDVPNPLQHRMSGHISINQIKLSIENAKLRINEQKVFRQAYQIGWLMDDVMAEIGAVNSGAPQDRLKDLHDVSRDICERIRGTRYANAAEMCLTLLRMAEVALEEKLADADVELMGRMAKIVARAFDPERESTASEYQRRARAHGLRALKHVDENDEAEVENQPQTEQTTDPLEAVEAGALA